jgi:Na+-transporting NADH:ubiquinone oxidoreductase subunit NqrE
MDADCSETVGVAVGVTLAVSVALTVTVSVRQIIQGLPAVLINSHNMSKPHVIAAIIPR